MLGKLRHFSVSQTEYCDPLRGSWTNSRWVPNYFKYFWYIRLAASSVYDCFGEMLQIYTLNYVQIYAFKNDRQWDLTMCGISDTKNLSVARIAA